MKKLVIASGNPGKLREIHDILTPHGFELYPQTAFNVPEAEEPHSTFIENALAKARQASHYSGLPALADDSGICVPILQNTPGVHSARYAGEPRSDARNNQKLLIELENYTDRSAYYYCVIVCVRHELDPCPVIAEGIWHGEIAYNLKGRNGFGYDPLFVVPEIGLTAAEMDADIKNQYSHRGKALQELVRKLELTHF